MNAVLVMVGIVLGVVAALATVPLGGEHGRSAGRGPDRRE